MATTADAGSRLALYSIQCVWGLALAHRRLNGGQQRGLEAGAAGLDADARLLLVAMLRRADKVERFQKKTALTAADAITAKIRHVPR